MECLFKAFGHDFIN